MTDQQEKILREIILNTRKPIVFRKFCPNWKCFDSSLKEWCKKFDDSLPNEKKSEFEYMPMKHTDCPQWERFRNKIEITLTDFLEKYSKDTSKWTAFNYQPKIGIPRECCHDLNFKCFGFEQATTDASFWLSSKGSNTPCHYDTYGCNIVVQVFGQKRWFLFPPETGLTAVRVPYEESSVYCSENFFSPKNLKNLSVARENAFECVLQRGDVLIVPKCWWHYVESLDTSLSVNTWIPLDIDTDDQIEECIVKYIVERCISNESESIKQLVFNPNQLELITSSEELFNILRFLVQNKSILKDTIPGRDCVENFSYQYLTETELQELIEKLNVKATELKLLDPKDFDKLLEENTKRFVETETLDSTSIHPLQAALLNAICHPNVIKMVKNEFLKKIMQ